MMRRMSRVLPAVMVGVLAGGLVAAASAAPRRKGKVVRIARTEPAVSTSLRFCQLHDLDVGTCPREVRVGEVGWVLDADGTYGQASITEASPFVDACGTPTTWNVTIDMSQLTRRDYSYSALLVLDHPLSDASRLLPTSQAPPAGRPGELVSQVLDDDGDGQGDVMITAFPCDERGRPAQGFAITHTCTDYWLEVRDAWRHARTDAVATCRR